jgi:hypothetical protein
MIAQKDIKKESILWPGWGENKPKQRISNAKTASEYKTIPAGSLSLCKEQEHRAHEKPRSSPSRRTDN